ncbi:phospholipase D-like domain-containing protein [Paraburkholderia antibiotica]|uniref:phospholipase D n=1 Tax=Paraburkholderia antibiotica TaxID=2728839 RepID=A0A7Y0A0D1_9BURK|nr:phospholipase D-like domain-containing protein [Paraburkholderia antibiotica]NML34154.1 phospholipase [Paraburkholderia antibiotica]
MSSDFQVVGTNAAAQFTLKLHRGEGMLLLAMNWRNGKPSRNFVGFAIEYREPNGVKFFQLKNRLAFKGVDGTINPEALSTMKSPIQKFRWVHFPRNAHLPGAFTYKVTPVFMDDAGTLTYGVAQEANIELMSETYPGELNVAFTRGFVSSQAFVDQYQKDGPISSLLPSKAAEGLDFTPTHPKADEAFAWMGFEARTAILDVLDKAVNDEHATVRVIAYDLNLPEIVERLEKLGSRLQIIIDNSKDHGGKESAETAAESRLKQSAGDENVKRQHVGNLQHNKSIVVDSPEHKLVVCGSTNFSWRGFYVQSNNALIFSGEKAVSAFHAAFEQYWNHPAGEFGESVSASQAVIDLASLKPLVAFSPHSASNAQLELVANDMRTGTSSSMLFSLAFIYQTGGAVRDAVKALVEDNEIFVYGISDQKVGGLDIQQTNGNMAPVYPAALTQHVPEPFKAEVTGGSGVRMHHKFVVIDFDKPTARVYTGSYNFSGPADTENGENLLLIKDRRVATAYMVEALRIFDHYRFRVAQLDAATAQKELTLQRSPQSEAEKPWWLEDYENPRKVKDRELFA